jgi:RimJ/RimL family protein N-acetyltransferase
VRRVPGNVASVLLRVMTEADVPDVLDVQEPGAVLGLADVFPQEEHPFPREEVARRWRQEVVAPDVDCYVVLVGGTVVGFAATRGEEFLHFGVAVDRWGTGVARAAHDAVLDLMRGRGVRRAWLRVFTGNRRGRRFYEKLGWQPTGECSRTSFPPHPELLRYERDLSLGG